jgi:hypothetical protein
MASSTSPSEPASRTPRLALRLLATAVATWAACASYTVRLNPEVRFFHAVHRAKLDWEPQVGPTNRVLFVAGSSCMTSLDPVHLEKEHGIHAMNLGLGAGMGPRFLARYALDRARPGDRMLLSFEQGLLAGPVGWDSLGVQFAAAIGRPDLLGGPDGYGITSTLLSLRPGGYHVFTLLGKLALRQPLYRYGAAEVRPGGWHAVAARRPVESLGILPDALSPQARQWLRELKAECDRKGIQVAYTPPWLYGSGHDASAMREANLRFLADVGTVLPVLRDEELGVHTEVGDYADTVAHPTPEGAAVNTDRMARLVEGWLGRR